MKLMRLLKNIKKKQALILNSLMIKLKKHQDVKWMLLHYIMNFNCLLDEILKHKKVYL